MGFYLQAGFMDGVEEVIKATLSDEDEAQKRVKSVVTLKTDFTKNATHKEEEGVVNMLSTELFGKEKKKKSSSLLEDTFTAMKEVTGIEKKKTDNRFFDGGLMGELSDMISLEEGESLGLPSIFGLNKKTEKTVFGSTILADTVLGDAKDIGTSIYRGVKYTGESTEFMSGVMYKSAKVYNGMFNIFDASPLNIFDDKKEREASVFDIIDKGNTLLDRID